MLSGLSSYLFGGPSEEGHPAATTQSATELAAEAAAAAAKRTPRLRTTSTDDDWTIVDPASRGNSPLRLESNSMENLLIEHPSMSVYEHRGRPNSRGTDAESSDESDSEMDTAQAPATTSRASGVNSRGSRSARLAAGLSAAVAMKAKKSAQAAHKRKESRKVSRAQLDRTNKVQKFNSMGKVPRRKQQMFRVNSGRNNDRKCHH